MVKTNYKKIPQYILIEMAQKDNFEALEELIPLSGTILDSGFELVKGLEIPHSVIIEKLAELGFERVDFVSAPGQFAVRGSIIDLFSFSDSEAVRISFWGDEIENIRVFNCNTQLSGGEVPSVKVISDMVCNPESASQNILEALPKDALLWLDSSDMYKEREFFPLTGRYKRVYLEVPIDRKDADAVQYSTKTLNSSRQTSGAVSKTVIRSLSTEKSSPRPTGSAPFSKKNVVLYPSSSRPKTSTTALSMRRERYAITPTTKYSIVSIEYPSAVRLKRRNSSPSTTWLHST